MKIRIKPKYFLLLLTLPLAISCTTTSKNSIPIKYRFAFDSTDSLFFLRQSRDIDFLVFNKNGTYRQLISGSTSDYFLYDQGEWKQNPSTFKIELYSKKGIVRNISAGNNKLYLRETDFDQLIKLRDNIFLLLSEHIDQNIFYKSDIVSEVDDISWVSKTGEEAFNRREILDMIREINKFLYLPSRRRVFLPVQISDNVILSNVFGEDDVIEAERIISKWIMKGKPEDTLGIPHIYGIPFLISEDTAAKIITDSNAEARSENEGAVRSEQVNDSQKKTIRGLRDTPPKSINDKEKSTGGGKVGDSRSKEMIDND